MKKLIIICLSLFAYTSSFAQALPPLNRYDLRSEEGCETADEIALKVADYLFETPMITDDENRMRAAGFLNRWMEGTPTYTFMIDEGITENFDEDPELTDMYMAALTRFTLQNPNITNEDEISIGALKQVLAYADNDDNLVLLPKRLQKLVAANQKGELEKQL